MYYLLNESYNKLKLAKPLLVVFPRYLHLSIPAALVVSISTGLLLMVITSPSTIRRPLFWFYSPLSQFREAGKEGRWVRGGEMGDLRGASYAREFPTYCKELMLPVCANLFQVKPIILKFKYFLNHGLMIL